MGETVEVGLTVSVGVWVGVGVCVSVAEGLEVGVRVCVGSSTIGVRLDSGDDEAVGSATDAVTVCVGAAGKSEVRGGKGIAEKRSGRK